MDDERKVIELVNKLQGYRSTTGCHINIQLPQIVVVGAQSSGKSSVLDGLVGSSILPRGSGTVTKCPIIVQLITTPNPDEEGVEFQDAPEDGRIDDYDSVRSMISERMEQGGGAIKDEPIIIKVFSPNVVTLTVVDLPGIKRLTTSGEPDDLEQLIFSLSRKYISEKNAIILAVSPANYDICNSDGILLAKEADPSGDRTIGVLTKLDLMDEGTNARSLLTGTSADVNVKLGMIGLVNRSQKDIDNNLSVEDQLKKERAYLEETYPDIADVNGVPFLRRRLHELLVNIVSCLPDILAQMTDLLGECEKSLEAIPNVTTQTDKYRYVSKIIQMFENRMKQEIEGSTRNPAYKRVYGGIKIKDVFEKKFVMDMERVGKRTNEFITDEMILTAFRNSGAYDFFFAYPEAVFRKLSQDQVKHLEEPALKCAYRVHEEIIRIADRFLHEQRHTLDLFPDFKKSMKSVVHGMLNDKLDEVKEHIKDYIRVQASVVFSLDKEFSEKLAKLRRKLEKNLNGEQDFEVEVVQFPPLVPPKLSKSSSDSTTGIFSKLKNPKTIMIIKEMAKMYFDLIKRQVQDYIPKIIADRLVTQFSGDEGNLGHELRVLVRDNFEKMIQLPACVNQKREMYAMKREHLKEVMTEVKEILAAHEYDDDSGYSDVRGGEGAAELEA